MTKKIALIPARGGSLRVKSKNIQLLGGHPLIAYSIQVALDSKIFDKVLVTTDCKKIQEIALYYGAEAPFLRPTELASAHAIDVEWIRHALDSLPEKYDIFSIIRPTSPFRTVNMLQRAMNQFSQSKEHRLSTCSRTLPTTSG